MPRSPAFLLSACLIAGAAHPLASQTVNAGTPEFFESKIRTILANNCFGCHTNSHLGDLRLDSLEAMKKGGKRGPALVPGDPDKSLLIKAVRQTDPDLKMPYGGKLKASEVAALEAWVQAGAAWPANTARGSSRKQRRQICDLARTAQLLVVSPIEEPAGARGKG